MINDPMTTEAPPLPPEVRDLREKAKFHRLRVHDALRRHIRLVDHAQQSGTDPEQKEYEASRRRIRRRSRRYYRHLTDFHQAREEAGRRPNTEGGPTRRNPLQNLWSAVYRLGKAVNEKQHKTTKRRLTSELVKVARETFEHLEQAKAKKQATAEAIQRPSTPAPHQKPADLGACQQCPWFPPHQPSAEEQDQLWKALSQADHVTPCQHQSTPEGQATECPGAAIAAIREVQRLNDIAGDGPINREVIEEYQAQNPQGLSLQAIRYWRVQRLHRQDPPVPSAITELARQPNASH